MKILGWYSLAMLTISAICNIGDSKSSGGIRVGSALMLAPTIVYIILNLFK